MADNPLRTRVLYLGVGAPHAPASGMDVVCRAHLDELLAAPSLEVTGVVVAPAGGGRGNLATFGGVPIVAGDPPRQTRSLPRAWHKMRYVLVGSGAIIAFAFRSAVARERIRKELDAGLHDVVVVDHFNTLANVGLRDLHACAMPVIYIAHDVTPEQIWETGRLKSRWRAPLFALEAAKAACVERALLRRARMTMFLSEADRRRYRRVPAPTMTLLPAIAAPKGAASKENVGRRTATGTLLFIGAPSFPPNAFAIRWLAERFAPALRAVAPSMRIVLAGRGTDAITAASGNLDGLGFVSDEDLNRMIETSNGVICPIVHGSGIKIKLLDAIARSSAVFATASALRGLEQFAITPTLDIADPAGSVACVLALAEDPALLAEERARLARLWEDHTRARSGRLVATVHDAARPAAHAVPLEVASSVTPPVQHEDDDQPRTC